MHVNGRSLYIVDWRLLWSWKGGNVLHYVERENCPGEEMPREMSGSAHSRQLAVVKHATAVAVMFVRCTEIRELGIFVLESRDLPRPFVSSIRRAGPEEQCRD